MLLTSTIAETKTLTVSLSGTALASTPQVTFVAGPVAAANSTLTGTPNVRGDGSVDATLTLVVADAFGNAIDGLKVTWSYDGATALPAALPATETDAAGKSTQFLACACVEAKTITASADGQNLQTIVQFTAPWTRRVGPLEGETQFYGVALDPANPKHIVIATGAGFNRSDDDGATWFPFDQGLQGSLITGFAFDDTPAAPMLYAAYDTNSNVPGVAKRSFGDPTWTDISSGLDVAPNVAIYGLVAAHNATSSFVVAGGNNGEVYRLDANTWTPIGTPFNTMLTTMVIDTSTSPPTLYASFFNNGIASVAIDAAASTAWTAVAGAPSAVYSLVIDQTNLKLYAVDSNLDTVLSADAGPTPSAFADYASPWPDNIDVVAIDATGELVFAGGAAAGSLDGSFGRFNGTSWVLDSAGLPTGSETLGGEQGPTSLFVSADGAIWLQLLQRRGPATPATELYRRRPGDAAFVGMGALTSAAMHGMAIDTTLSPPTIYVANSSGVMFSSDNGMHWRDYSDGLSADSVGHTQATSIAFDAAHDRLFVTGTKSPGSELATRSIGDASWTPTADAAVVGAVGVAIDPQTSIAYAWDGSTLVASLAPGDTSWSAATNGLASTSVSSLVIDGTTSPSTLIIAANDGLFVTPADTIAWTALPIYPVANPSIAIDTSTQTLWAASAGQVPQSLVYASESPAWSPLSAGLPATPDTGPIFVDNSRVPAVVFVGAHPEGESLAADFYVLQSGSWVSASSGLGALPVQALFFASQNVSSPGLAYLATASAFYVSDSGGR